MLRITRINQDDATPTLKLEGKLLAAWVSEVLEAVSAFNGHATQVRLDLSSVAFVDAAGTELLRQLVRQGVAIAACSRFVTALLHEENS